MDFDKYYWSYRHTVTREGYEQTELWRYDYASLRDEYTNPDKAPGFPQTLRTEVPEIVLDRVPDHVRPKVIMLESAMDEEGASHVEGLGWGDKNYTNIASYVFIGRLIPDSKPTVIQ